MRRQNIRFSRALLIISDVGLKIRGKENSFTHLRILVTSVATFPTTDNSTRNDNAIVMPNLCES